MVRRAGIEPARCFHRRILSPVRLPVPPPSHKIKVGILLNLKKIALTTTLVYFGGMLSSFSQKSTLFNQ